MTVICEEGHHLLHWGTRVPSHLWSPSMLFLVLGVRGVPLAPLIHLFKNKQTPVPCQSLVYPGWSWSPQEALVTSLASEEPTVQ